MMRSRAISTRPKAAIASADVSSPSVMALMTISTVIAISKRRDSMSVLSAATTLSPKQFSGRTSGMARQSSQAPSKAATAALTLAGRARPQRLHLLAQRPDLGQDHFLFAMHGSPLGMRRDLAFLLHGRDDDADEEVEDGEGGGDDEGDEEDPGPGIDVHDRAHDAHRPAL